jgi:superfamily II DNA or RNA helicase
VILQGLKLRDYQQRSVDQLRAAYARGVRRILLSLPTGAGKTIVAAEIIRLANLRRPRSVCCSSPDASSSSTRPSRSSRSPASPTFA